jgi:hypothetical protein
VLKKLSIICLFNFFIASVLGLLLRYASIGVLPINYRYLTHAHSHVAMLGWVYLMLYSFVVFNFIAQNRKKYIRLFWVTQIAVLGMLFSFPFQGYATLSIIFSTLHILCSYMFVLWVWKDLKIYNDAATLLLKIAMLFMLLSTVGVWALGPVIQLFGNGSVYYDIAIQFFLHFQFNGWFLFAVVAVFFRLISIENSKLFRQFYQLLIAATVLTMALPIHWFAPNPILLLINGFGVITQIIALYLFFQLVKPKWAILQRQSTKLASYMFGFALLCFVLKIVFQSISILPEFATIVYEHHNFIIGFVHLLMLGVISGFLFAFILKGGLVKSSIVLNFGCYSFLLGFVLTELLLLVQGVLYYFDSSVLTSYSELLFLCSILMPVGIGIILIHILINKAHTT